MNPNAKPSKITILIADDDRDDQEILKMALNKFSPAMNIQCVNDGQELMDYLGDNSIPSFIFLDLNMPKKDGKAALNEIKSNKLLKNIPVLIFSTSSAPQDINQTYSLGANSFITKPRNFKSMVETVNQVCNYWIDTITLPLVYSLK